MRNFNGNISIFMLFICIRCKNQVLKIVLIMQLQEKLFLTQDLTLTLEELEIIDNFPQQNLIGTNLFAAYQSSSSNQISQIQITLKAIDTQKIPKIPMRRVSCIDCLNRNMQCQNCSKCKMNKCCRNIGCIYDYQEWKINRQNQCYKKCKCFAYSTNSDRFYIDWRLLSIIQKIPYEIRKKQVPLSLSKARNCLWINGLQQSSNTSKINHIFYQDNFTTNNFFQKSIKSSNPQTIKTIITNNSMNLQNIFKVNIKNYLKKKENWDLSNLQRQCEQITDEFLKDKRIEKMTKQLLRSNQTQTSYSSMTSLKYEGKYLQNISKDRNENKIQQGNKYSKQINQNILFYFCKDTQLIFIKNAKFHVQDNDFANLRPIRILFTRKNMNFANFHWFKDKIGDIFAIYKDELYIFKYDLDTKCYNMLYLYSHRCFSMVESSNSILYVAQRDIVYYFHAKNIKESFYFRLNRPKINDKQSKLSQLPIKNSCNQVILYKTAFDEINIQITTNTLKSTYIMEDTIYKIGNKQFRSYIPIIYLFFQRKSYEPYGIGVMSIVHIDNIQCREIVTNDIKGRTGKLNNVELDKSLIFTVRRDKCPCFYLYALNNQAKVLIGVKIQQKNQKKSLNWEQQSSNLRMSHEFKFQSKKLLKQQQSYYEPHSYLVIPSSNNNPTNHPIFYKYVQYNDIAGLPSNNEFKLLTLNRKTNNIEQIGVNFIQADPKWQINDQP